ncbi:MAG: zinc ribbon domain-containing protein [Pseudomonadota bacterium]
MPIYEYQCAACGHTFDTLQKISEPPLTRCPACGEETLKKLISPAGFRLKGGGWYETDFKTGSKKNVAGAEKPAAGGADKPSKDGAKAAGGTSKPKPKT